MAKTLKKPKLKFCKVCNKPFMPWSTTEKVCGYKCAIEYARQQEEKKFKAETNKMRKALNDVNKSYQLAKAQDEFNRYIRLRDEKEPCISCGITSGQMQAGHYKTVGGHPELRFSELNCHKQCSQCNNKKSGNIIAYRINLIKKIGTKAVEWLEGPHELQKLTLDDIKEIRAYFKDKIKTLKQDKE